MKEIQIIDETRKKKKHIQTETEWQEQMCEKLLNQVRSEIYLDLHYLKIALSALEPKVDEALKTFATDGTYFYYPMPKTMDLFEKNPKYLERAYLHVILHCLFRQLWTAGGRLPRLWNLACDISVEYTMDQIDKPCTKRILTYLRSKTYEDLKKENIPFAPAAVYSWLIRLDGDGLADLEREFVVDDHRFWPKREDGQAPVPREQEAMDKWDKISRQTSLEQRQGKNQTDEGENLLLQQVRVKKSRHTYGEFLKKFAVLHEELKVDPDEFDLNYYSYGLRLYGNMPLMEPLESRESNKIRDFVVIIDTSYSTNGALVERFLKETFTLLTEGDSFFYHNQIHLIQCDDQVRSDQVVESIEDIDRLLHKFTLVGGGSTDFRPAFSYVNHLVEQGSLRNLCGLLYFTDGKGIYPSKRPDYQTAFLYMEDYDESLVPSWAIRLRIDPYEW